MAKLPRHASCSRRAILQGLGAATAGLYIAGCQAGSSLPPAATSACGASTCIDLADPANAALASVGGALVFDTSTDTVMVIRTSATQVVALSAICTHAGCEMDYLSNQELVDCPCHGSQFDLSGRVTRGPAHRGLNVYTATLANDVITIAA
jgi:cytochrome b6-f complex iron-sulfur subunit